MREMIQQAIQQALDEAPERKFVETIETVSYTHLTLPTICSV